jgi:predicted PurR-regulated permease PerM
MDTSHQHAGFLVLLALVTIAFFWVLLPFYGAVFWAVILAIIFNPMHRALERRMGGRRNLAAMLSVLVCIVIAIIPMIVVVTSLVAEGTRLVQRIQENPIDLAGLQGQVQAALPARLGPWFEGIDFNELRERLSSAFVEGSQIVAGQALNIGQNTLKFFVSAGIMLYVLFFLFRDGPAIGRNIRPHWARRSCRASLA